MVQASKMIKKIKIGTRGSKLALWQANLVKTNIERYFDSIDVKIIEIQTRGDRDQASSLTQVGGQGIFTKAIEDELLYNNIDFAVHSLKDLPTALTDSTKLGAVLKRGLANDAFIGSKINDFEQLPVNSIVASGSIRRRAQILNIRPDIQFVDLRGNIDTRVMKLFQNGYDGIMIAEAAIKRLNFDQIHRYHRFATDEIIPAVGQAAIGLQVRKADEQFNPVLEKINDKKTFDCVSAERAFLKTLDSGCTFPVGAYAKIKRKEIKLTGVVLSIDGKEKIKESMTLPVNESDKIGEMLAKNLIQRGALKLLKGETN